MLENNEVVKYLDRIREIKKSYPLYDLHVHPFEVLGEGFTYLQNLQDKDVYSVNSAPYTPPATGQLKLKQPAMTGPRPSAELRAKMALLTARRLYAHTGAKPFADHMRLSGIAKILLLPVMSSAEAEDLQMKMLRGMFGDDDRFALGYCVPNRVANHEISSHVRAAVARYKIKALKIHPNVTEIDLSASSGKERVEYIIEAAGKADLPVVIHGGRSNGLKDPLAAAHGMLENLQHLDWGQSSAAVIIAHAGTYGHDLAQIQAEILPLMNKLLARHDNLFVDIAGVEFEVLNAIVTTLDRDRILFGSDALYYCQWEAVVKLMHVLRNKVGDYEECFIKIVSLNPASHFFIDEQPPNQSSKMFMEATGTKI
jgi:glutaredoxin